MSENNGNGNGSVLLISTRQKDMLGLGRVILPSSFINSKRVSNTDYVVCCEASSGTAFMVVKVEGVGETEGEPTYVTFSEYADVNRARVYQLHGNERKPFSYVESLRSLRLGNLTWQTVEVEEESIPESDIPITRRKTVVGREDVKIFERINELREELEKLQAKKREAIHAMIDRLEDADLDKVLIAIEPLLA